MQRESEVINWNEVKKALDIYKSCPSKDSAMRLLAVIPEVHASQERGEKLKVTYALLEGVPFEKEVVAGDEILAETTFRLLGYFMGGAISEELTIMLGRFLIRKPTAFLQLLKKYLQLFPSERDYPVDMTEIQEIVPDITSEKDLIRKKQELLRIYNERIKALEGVEDPELTKLRDVCIRVIKKIIESIGKIEWKYPNNRKWLDGEPGVP
jgi:hypothetical protein